MIDACQLCVHWNPTQYKEEYYDHSYGDETYKKKEQGWGYCNKISNPCGPGNSDSQKAFTIDGSGYTSYLLTRYDFGCIEFSRFGATVETVKQDIPIKISGYVLGVEEDDET